MREYSTPGVVVPEAGNLTRDVVRHASQTPDRVLFSRPSAAPDAPGWEDITAAAFRDQVTAVAKGLIAAGVEAGDRVAILSRTRYEWTLLDYAIWFAGAITVPVYETCTAEEIAWILHDSGTRAIVVEGPEHADRVAGVRDGLTELRHVWSLSDDAIGGLARRGEGVGDVVLQERRDAAGPDDLATLIYTSGTTGRPKGCMLTHGNFDAELTAATESLAELFDDDAATLLFLPLAHVLARVIQVGCVRKGVRLGHSSDVRALPVDLRAFAPNFVLAVPRFFENVYNTASQQAAADGRGASFDKATQVAIAWSRARDQQRPRPVLEIQHRVFDRLVYRKLREALGGRCTFAVSGGAPLGERLAHFYRGVGISILEGYGLSETTGAVAVNRPDATKIGTVGQPVPGTTVRVADDGELSFSGPQVFAGYWGAPEATAQVLVDGWLRTGDVGEVDDEGFVRIGGRKKEILVTAGGKTVSPSLLEGRLRTHRLISQCLVVGDGQPYVAALITLDPDTTAAWAGRRGKGSLSLTELAHDPDLIAAVGQAVDQANKAVSKAESIRKFSVLATQWTEEDGQLTPNLKLKRNLVTSQCKDDIAALFAT